MNTNWIGVAFVSEEVPNREQVEDQLAERTEALRQEAQTALDAWLNEQGLEQVMGVIILKKTIQVNRGGTNVATLIIEMDGGLVNEVYSTLLEPLNIQVYDTDDRRDPEHAYLYAASIYALQFGGMRPQFRRGHDYSDRIWGALERRPESAALVSDLRRAASQAGIQAQAQDAAFLAGYLEAFGEFKEFVDYLSAEKKVNAEFRQQIDRLLDRQMEKYFTFAEQINTPERYDGGHDETAISGRTLDCEGGAKDGV